MFNRWKKRPYNAGLLLALEQWFDSDRGVRVLREQQVLIDELLGSCFGYHLLQLSIDSRPRLFRDCRVQYKYRAHPSAISADVLSDFEQLPFANESLDIVIVHHVQEFIDNPHQLLREINRVVVPHGRVIVVGFNPWSPLGVFSRVGHWLPGSIWHNHLIGVGRMQDWLALLGFGASIKYYGHHSPSLLAKINKPWLARLLKHWPFGSFYVISAIKEELTMTPIRPRWRQAGNGFTGLAPIKTGALGNVGMAGETKASHTRAKEIPEAS